MAVYVVRVTKTPEKEAFVVWDAPGSSGPFSLGVVDRGTTVEEEGYSDSQSDVAGIESDWNNGILPYSGDLGAIPVRFSYTTVAGSNWIHWTASVQIVAT